MSTQQVAVVGGAMRTIAETYYSNKLSFIICFLSISSRSIARSHTRNLVSCFVCTHFSGFELSAFASIVCSLLAAYLNIVWFAFGGCCDDVTTTTSQRRRHTTFMTTMTASMYSSCTAAPYTRYTKNTIGWRTNGQLRMVLFILDDNNFFFFWIYLNNKWAQQ